MASKAAKRHEQLVEYVARHLKQRFYDDIRTHAGDHRPPAQIGNGGGESAFVPDVTMVARGAKFNVMEVETAETLKKADTAEKWQTFAHHAEQCGGTFWVVVPRSSGNAARRKLQALDLRAKVWEVESPELTT